MRTVVLIQARMGSTRLPGKIALPLDGKPVLWHVWARCRQALGGNNVYIAAARDVPPDHLPPCPTPRTDRPDTDVLGRFADVAGVIGLAGDDRIVRVTADCPFLDPRLVRIAASDDYCLWWDHATGNVCETFSVAGLYRADYDTAPDDPRREHVCPALPYFERDETYPPAHPRYRLELNTAEDYERLSALATACRASTLPPFRDVLATYDRLWPAP